MVAIQCSLAVSTQLKRTCRSVGVCVCVLFSVGATLNLHNWIYTFSLLLTNRNCPLTINGKINEIVCISDCPDEWQSPLQKHALFTRDDNDFAAESIHKWRWCCCCRCCCSVWWISRTELNKFWMWHRQWQMTFGLSENISTLPSQIHLKNGR